MNLVQRITADPLQNMNLLLPDGSVLFLEIYYRPSQQGWFINQIQHPTLNGGNPVFGIKLCNSGNLLRQFKNIIPFGLACYTADNREPSQLEDFASGASQLYTMTAQDVADYEAALAAGG